MSILINCNSANAEIKVSNSDFTVVMQDPIVLPNLNYVCYIRTVDTFNSVPNVDNETIRWTYNGSSFDYIVPTGVYSVEDINTVMQEMFDGSELSLSGDWGVDGYPVEFIVSYQTGKITANLNALSTCSIERDFANEFFGFDGTSSFVSVSGLAPNVADVNRGVLNYQITCDLVNRSFSNGQTGQVLTSFSPSVPAWGKVFIEPINPPKLQVNKTNISSVHMKLVDNNNNVLDLNGENLAVQLVIEPMH